MKLKNQLKDFKKAADDYIEIISNVIALILILVIEFCIDGLLCWAAISIICYIINVPCIFTFWHGLCAAAVIKTIKAALI